MIADRLAQAEIEQPQAVLGHDHVARLDVAMQHAAAMGIGECLQQGNGNFLQLIPGHALRVGADQVVQRRPLEQLHRDVGAAAAGVGMKTVQLHHMGMVQTAGEGILAVQQRVGVRVLGEGVVQRLDGNPGLGVAELLAQQVRGPVHRAHAADAEQAFDAVALAQQVRYRARRQGLLPGRWIRLDGWFGGGDGSVHEISCRIQRRMTTALMLSRAGPSSASSNSRSSASWVEGRLRARPRSAPLMFWYRPSLHSNRVSPG